MAFRRVGLSLPCLPDCPGAAGLALMALTVWLSWR